MRFVTLLLAATCAPWAASAQSSVTFQAPTGSVSSTLYITMNLAGGGTAYISPAIGPNCSLGQTCRFTGASMSYTLPNGTTAALSRISGVFEPVGSAYELLAHASGVDSAGRKVRVSRLKTVMTITCNRGCTITYVDGHLTITTK